MTQDGECERRLRVRRSNERHQWERDRVRAGREERGAAGATEYDTGLAPGDLVFHAEYRGVRADGELAGLLGVRVGTELLERLYRTRRRGEEAPLDLTRSYLVREMVSANPDLLDPGREPWPGGTQSQLYTVGIEIERVEERLTARPPTPEEARELALPPGTAVMVLRKASVDTGGRVVDWAEVVLPGDRTEAVFTTRLERWRR